MPVIDWLIVSHELVIEMGTDPLNVCPCDFRQVSSSVHAVGETAEGRKEGLDEGSGTPEGLLGISAVEGAVTDLKEFSVLSIAEQPGAPSISIV